MGYRLILIVRVYYSLKLIANAMLKKWSIFYKNSGQSSVGFLSSSAISKLVYVVLEV